MSRRRDGRQRRNLLSALVAAVYALAARGSSERLYRRLQSEEIRAGGGDLTIDRLAFLTENSTRLA